VPDRTIVGVVLGIIVVARRGVVAEIAILKGRGWVPMKSPDAASGVGVRWWEGVVDLAGAVFTSWCGGIRTRTAPLEWQVAVILWLPAGLRIVVTILRPRRRPGSKSVSLLPLFLVGGFKVLRHVCPALDLGAVEVLRHVCAALDLGFVIVLRRACAAINFLIWDLIVGFIPA